MFLQVTEPDMYSKRKRIQAKLDTVSHRHQVFLRARVDVNKARSLERQEAKNKVSCNVRSYSYDIARIHGDILYRTSITTFSYLNVVMLF